MGEIHPAIPLLCVCGNHDVGNRPTASSVEAFKKDFGDDYFVFWIDKMKGIVLNTNLYFDPSAVRDIQTCARSLLYKQQVRMNHLLSGREKMSS